MPLRWIKVYRMILMMKNLLLLLALASASFAQDGFTPLFNGKDLTFGMATRSCGRWRTASSSALAPDRTGPDALAHNSFLIWRSGKVGDFELRATVRVMGDNNSGIQYRSLELLEVVPWVITGYQCDIHQAHGHDV